MLATDAASFDMGREIIAHLRRRNRSYEFYFVANEIRDHDLYRGLLKRRPANSIFVETGDYRPVVEGDKAGAQTGRIGKLMRLAKHLWTISTRGTCSTVMFHQVADHVTLFCSRLLELQGSRLVVFPPHLPFAANSKRFGLAQQGAALRSPLLWIARRLSPKWLQTSDGILYARIAPAKIILHALLGLRLRDPWRAYGGYLSALIVDQTESMQDWHGVARFPASVQQLGRPSDFMLLRLIETPGLAARYRDRMLGSQRRLPEPAAGKILIVLIAPNQQSMLQSSGQTASLARCMFQSYRDYIDTMVMTCRWLREQLNCDVAVSIHPRNRSELLADFQALGVTSCNAPGRRLPLIADGILSYVGSTLMWEYERCGVPHLSIDLFGYRQQLGNLIPAERTIAAAADVQERLRRWVLEDVDGRPIEERLLSSGIASNVRQMEQAMGLL